MEKTSLLFEELSTKLFKNKPPKTLTDIDVDTRNITKSVKQDYDEVSNNIGFFDYTTSKEQQQNSYFQHQTKSGVLYQQADLIEEYRKIGNSPEGRIAVDEIINEAIFTPGGNEILKISIDDTKLTEQTCDIIVNEFKEITDIFDIEMNLSYLFERWYIDGQLIIQIVYDNDDITKGIIGFNILEPKFMTYNKTKQYWVYAREVVKGFLGKKELVTDEKDERKFLPEEIIFLSSELYEVAQADVMNEGLNIIKSHLHQAIKVHNQLTTMEDMLIPMRFSRSVSRRVFNVDVGDLSSSKSEAALNKIKDKFKYKKYYDVEKGTISNQMHIASLVEDYWFQNRGGSKGTTVETLDETGNLGELGDIIYFRKKLYTALKIPLSRVADESGQTTTEFDYSGTQVSREEIKFFAFIQKLRKQFLRLFREALKRHMLYKGTIKDENEWNLIRKNIKISFYKENIFLETMETTLLQNKISVYNDVVDLIGKEFSRQWVRKNVLKMSEKEIDENQQQIAKESSEAPAEEKW